MDIALILDILVPGSNYRGSLTANSREAYEAITWEDTRKKPSWEDIIQTKLPPTPIDKQQLINETLEILVPILEIVYVDEALLPDIKEKISDKIKIQLEEKIGKLKEVFYG